jgi:demethylmenaquinone methyltransferase/2-methoxy-6-polyprenyl-1,4-benzoquinol methylase
MKPEVKPYNSSEDHKSQVRSMFNNIASSYDYMNKILSLGIDHYWRSRLIREVKICKPKIVLDMATGTADIAISLALGIPGIKNITGVDLSAKMINYGREKCQIKKVSDKVNLELGDAENLRFEDNSFDAITVGFGVRNFSNVLLGIKELERVLKPGGRLWVLEFSKPTFPLVKFFFGLYFKFLLPLVGRWGSNDPSAYKYLYESVQIFPQGKDFMTLLAQGGLEPLYFKKLTFGICCIYCSRKK